MINELLKEPVAIEHVTPRGFFRIQVTEERDGKQVVVSDTGEIENQITNLGFQNYMLGALGNIGGYKQVGYAALGTGGAPAAGDTTLAGEIASGTKRSAVVASVISYKTLRFQTTFLYTNSFLSVPTLLSNVGLFSSTDPADNIFAGGYFSAPIVQTNQNVVLTYEIRVA